MPQYGNFYRLSSQNKLNFGAYATFGFFFFFFEIQRACPNMVSSKMDLYPGKCCPYGVSLISALPEVETRGYICFQIAGFMSKYVTFKNKPVSQKPLPVSGKYL